MTRYTVATPPQGIQGQSLVDFFADSRHKNVDDARQVLMQAIGRLDKCLEPIGNLSVESARVQVSSAGLSVYFADQPDTRHKMYDDPEPDASPWFQNQYALGVAMHYALSGRPGMITVPLHQLAPGLGLNISEAISRMVRDSSKDRFLTPADAIEVVSGIIEPGRIWRRVFKWLAIAAAIFLVFVSAALFLWYKADNTLGGLFPKPDHRIVDGDGRPPKPDGGHAAGQGDMVLVQGGQVELQGTTKPVAAFHLDAKAVTVSQYENYARAKGKFLPFGDNADYAREHADHPVWNVSWNDAAAYCADNGKRLPSEFEFKRATDTGGYAWGAGQPAPGQANLDSGTLAGVGTTPGDKTASGIFDLTGNIPEWTSDDYGQGMKAVRGGGYYLPASVVGQRLAISPDLDAGRGYLRVGFRCAAN
jgi:hypothetical protein